MAAEEEARLGFRADIKLSILDGSDVVKWAGNNPGTATTSSHLRKRRRGAPFLPCSGIDQRYVPAGVGYLSHALTIFHAALSIKQQIKKHTHTSTRTKTLTSPSCCLPFWTAHKSFRAINLFLLNFPLARPESHAHAHTHTHLSTGNLLKDIHFEYMSWHATQQERVARYPKKVPHGVWVTHGSTFVMAYNLFGVVLQHLKLRLFYYLFPAFTSLPILSPLSTMLLPCLSGLSKISAVKFARKTNVKPSPYSGRA